MSMATGIATAVDPSIQASGQTAPAVVYADMGNVLTGSDSLGYIDGAGGLSAEQANWKQTLAALGVGPQETQQKPNDSVAPVIAEDSSTRARVTRLPAIAQFPLEAALENTAKEMSESRAVASQNIGKAKHTASEEANKKQKASSAQNPVSSVDAVTAAELTSRMAPVASQSVIAQTAETAVPEQSISWVAPVGLNVLAKSSSLENFSASATAITGVRELIEARPAIGLHASDKTGPTNTDSDSAKTTTNQPVAADFSTLNDSPKANDESIKASAEMAFAVPARQTISDSTAMQNSVEMAVASHVQESTASLGALSPGGRHQNTVIRDAVADASISPGAEQQEPALAGARFSVIQHTAIRSAVVPVSKGAAIGGASPVLDALNISPLRSTDQTGLSMDTTSRSASVSTTVSADCSDVGTTFLALDSGKNVPSASWSLANVHSLEAGYRDPSLGWVSVRAQQDASGIHATVVPVSSDAAQSLGTHLAGLTTYLTEHRTSVDSVTIAAPDVHLAGQSAGSSADAQGQQRSNHDQSGEPHASTHSGVVTEPVADANPLVAVTNSGGGTLISVLV